MEKEFDHLRLENQICFLLYASSREMTKQYKPLLEELDVTYPQYLVLLLLWEHKQLSVKKLGEQLYLDSGTLTPMLKRMEQHDLINRKRSEFDERSVTIQLTDKGQALKNKASSVPLRIAEIIGNNNNDIDTLKSILLNLLETLRK
ncbi:MULTISPECIES: MarR family winged helix-turn-helix transcriptional regulator [Bacillus]|uniref:MarR family transcriptional regulator n=2 Tax=Bacillus TaxID=1386 RepID=A0A0M4FRU8_9BACI|nr:MULTISPECIES: MarR family transcriptional regulator [Bacillus]ALC82348.1 MarR family transcriptional regulator [Bacillus gobiensis]MBP1081215.1 DNA-binding MarR family transcriptional regulator [Bacillus capparidis]MED1095895.1 MarR family transcriptional regulator [Bacillus capparidis]